MILKLLLGIAGIAVIGFIAVFAAVWICAWLPRKCGRRDCLIVLGAKLHPDGSMSRSLEGRCEAALQAYKEGVAPLLIACGGQIKGTPCSEAEAMRAYLMRAGIPGEKILLEDRSVNTYENLRNTRKIMDEKGLRTAALVTSDYHVERALWLARGVGIEVCGIAAPSSKKIHHYLKARFRETISWMLYAKCEINKKLQK